jgi:hypothetical protein
MLRHRPYRVIAATRLATRAHHPDHTMPTRICTSSVRSRHDLQAKESDMPDRDTMATAPRTEPRFTVRPADDPTYDVDPGRGWVLFAGVMLAIVGVLNVAYGIAAISDSQFYARGITFVLGNLNTWGWCLLVVGAVQMAVSIGVFRASETARWLGIGFAAANALVQFLVLPAQPGWAIMIFFVDVIIIFGLLTYGGRDRHNLG